MKRSLSFRKKDVMFSSDHIFFLIFACASFSLGLYAAFYHEMAQTFHDYRRTSISTDKEDID
jgi:hypothetical protein